MEHINITDLGTGYVRLTAKRGWKIFAKPLRRIVSEAVVKEADIDKFEAVAIDDAAPAESGKRSKK